MNTILLLKGYYFKEELSIFFPSNYYEKLFNRESKFRINDLNINESIFGVFKIDVFMCLEDY